MGRKLIQLASGLWVNPEQVDMVIVADGPISGPGSRIRVVMRSGEALQTPAAIDAPEAVDNVARQINAAL